MRSAPTILVTGAGGAALPFILSSLKTKGYRVLAADMDPGAAGLFLSDRGYVIPQADSADFLPVVKKICKKESVDVIIPLVDEELLSISELEHENIITLIPRSGFIQTCLDKYRLIQSLLQRDIPVPRTRLASDGIGDLPYPCIVKPRTGRGSRNVGLLNSERDWTEWKSTARDHRLFILQEFLEGTEYTVSVVAWRDGRVQAVVPKEVISKKGITRLAVTRHNSRIEDYCGRIQEKLRADGPFNVQLICDKKTGEPRLFEINPRFSTTVSLTIMAGIDEVHGLIQQALKGPGAFRFGQWDEGIVLIRYTQDSSTTEEEFYKKYPFSTGAT